MEHTLPGFGITASFVNIHDLDEVEAAIQENTRAVYIETLGNPNSDIPDIDALAALAHRHGIPLVVDNTFGTPYFIRPIEHGADIVVHSATKFLGGHGTTLGGLIVDSGNFDWAVSGKYPAIAEPNPSYHGVSFVKAAGPAAFVSCPRDPAPGHGSVHFSICGVFAAAGDRNAVAPSGTPCGKHETGGGIFKWPSTGRKGEPSVAPVPSGSRTLPEIFSQWGSIVFTFDIKGGAEAAYNLSIICRCFHCLPMWRM